MDLTDLRNYVTEIIQEKLQLTQLIGSNIKEEVQETIFYVNNHYKEKLTLDMIAEHVRLNREYLSRLFSKEIGISLFQYINELKMEQAANLIKSNKNMYIKEVANNVGFDDQFFFSRKFKDYFGQSPTEFAANKDDKANK